MGASSHKRNPSAPPNVLVHPTHIPGMFSLAKPPRPSPRQHQQPSQRHQRTPKSKSTPSAQSTPELVRAQVVNNDIKSAHPSGAVTDLSKATMPTPSEKSARGRQHAKPLRDKTTRRDISQPQSRRPSRQPSPPTTSSPAEVATVPRSKFIHTKNALNHHQRNLISRNVFDPFVDSDIDHKSSTIATLINPIPPTPTISSRPNGTLASRRKGRAPGSSSPPPAKMSTPSFPETSTPTKAMTIPRRPNNSSSPASQLSRSDPLVSRLRSSSTSSPWDDFPICDDTTEYGGDFSPQTTTPSLPNVYSNASGHGRTRSGSAAGSPTHARFTHAQYDDGPRTAPLSSNTWPVSASAQSTPSRPRLHQRTPSEGIFPMSISFDENTNASEELKAYLGLTAKGMKGVGKKPFFASSMFQNSPSPDELPEPSFGAGVDVFA